MTDTTQLTAKGRKYYVPNYKPREMIIDRGEGARIWDIEGRDYIDFGAGIAVAALGYNHPALVTALTAQAQKIWHTSNIFYTEPPIRLAEALVEASQFATRVFFCNSGGEANEAAIKLARKTAADRGVPPEKRVILTFTGSFHGRTLATVTATAQPKYQQGFEPLPGGFEYLPYNDFDAVAQRMAQGDVCAVILETVQGEGGVMPSAPGFLAHLRKFCDTQNALLIIDDVQAGMGRTGVLFSHMHEGIKPDVVTLAKGLGGGFPIGAMLVASSAAEVFQFGSHGTTFGGNPLATAVAGAVLAELQKPELTANVKTRAKQLVDGLVALDKQVPMFKEVRGRGLMIGAELLPEWHGKAGYISEAARKSGVIVLQAGPNVLRFVPPLTIAEADVEEGLARLRAALQNTIGG